MDNLELLFQVPIEELQKGYTRRNDDFICLFCSHRCTSGIIYPLGSLLLEAERAIQAHIAEEHGAVFQVLLNLDRRVTGLTDAQKELLEGFWLGKSDKDLATGQNITASTIRNHRFKFKERERQARIFVALMGLMGCEPQFIPIHKGATMVDDRYAITTEEEQEILDKYVKDGKLTVFPPKEKRKLVVLRHLAGKFQPDTIYHEKQINEIIKEFYSDYVTLRRYLIEYGFLERNRDGSEYRLV